MLVEDFSNAFAYHRVGAPGERGPCGQRPSEGPLHRRRISTPACSRGSTFSNEALPQTGRSRSADTTTCSTV
jgi:hypothetical protein